MSEVALTYSLVADHAGEAIRELGRSMDRFARMSSAEQDEFLDQQETRLKELIPAGPERDHLIKQVNLIRRSQNRMTQKEAIGCLGMALYFGAVAGIPGAALGCAIGAAVGAL